MPIRYFLLISAALLLGTPLAAQQKKKPAATPKPAAKAATSPQPKPASAPAKEPEAYGYLLVDTDLDVSISVNYGKTYRVLNSDEGKRIPLEAGDNLLKIKPLDGGQDSYAETIKMDTKGNRVYSVKLKAQRDAKAAQLAEEKRKAEEARLAEQRRKEEEARVPSMINDPLVRTFILVKGGTFTMGCTSEQSDCEFDENPAHQVRLSNFYLGETEVTQAQWRAVMGGDPSYFKNCDDCPVENVSWDDIQGFISRLNSRSGGARYRLPTEAEWEYAARGGSQSRGYQYAGSNYLDEVAWYDSNSGKKTHPVKTKKANELGLYDISGNVWEWCADWYGSYSSGSQTNPTGPDSGTLRMDRGGSWSGALALCRAAFRRCAAPDSRSNNLGFRLARTP